MLHVMYTCLLSLTLLSLAPQWSAFITVLPERSLTWLTGWAWPRNTSTLHVHPWMCHYGGMASFSWHIEPASSDQYYYWLEQRMRLKSLYADSGAIASTWPTWLSLSSLMSWRVITPPPPPLRWIDHNIYNEAPKLAVKRNRFLVQAQASLPSWRHSFPFFTQVARL